MLKLFIALGGIMHREFEVTTEDNLKKYELILTGNSEKHEYKMKIEAMMEKHADFFMRRLTGLKNGYEATGSTLNFTLMRLENENSIVIEGNLANALEMLKDHGLLSQNAYHQIFNDKEVKEFLAKSKEFKLSKEEISDEILFASYRNDNEQPKLSTESVYEIEQLEKKLAAAYQQLPLSKFQEKLNNFILLLSQENRVEIEINYGTDDVPNPHQVKFP